MENNHLAFLDLTTLENGTVLRGGCLVTDLETNPMEFRCTAAIRPTELQRMLYGKKLIEYVCKDLVGIPILEKIKIKPDIVLVRISEFLRLRPHGAIPIIFVEREQDKVRLQSHSNYRDEVSAATPLLMKIDDINEPFTRVQNALLEAHRLKVGDK